MLKKMLKQASLPFAASFGATLGAIILYQKLTLYFVNKKAQFNPCSIFSYGNLKISYEKQGYGRKMLLLHSLYPGASGSEWEKAAKMLSEDFCVYLPDLPGFGRSDKMEKPWTAYQYAAFLHDFWKKEIQSPVVVLAANGSADLLLVWSMLYPEDLEKLVLISPEGFGKGFATKEDTKNLKLLLSPIAGTQKFLNGTTKKKIKNLLEEMFYEKERLDSHFVEQVYHSARFGKNAQVTYAALQTRFAAAETKNAFEQLQKPFLLIWGEENQKNPWKYLEDAEKTRENGEFLLFEHTAALPHMENTASFVHEIEEFLK